jgi:hypothetical protein
VAAGPRVQAVSRVHGVLALPCGTPSDARGPLGPKRLVSQIAPVSGMWPMPEALPTSIELS